MGDHVRSEDLEGLLTVKEFAVAAGVSTQTIYKQLATRLTTYVVRVDKRTMLRKTALYEVFGVELCNSDATELVTDATQFATQIELLQMQLEEAEELKDLLQRQLGQAEERERANRATIDSLTKLLEQQQQLTAQQQALSLADKQKILELEGKIQEFEAPAVIDPEADKADPEDPVPESSGIWQKMRSWLGF